MTNMAVKHDKYNSPTSHLRQSNIKNTAIQHKKLRLIYFLTNRKQSVYISQESSWKRLYCKTGQSYCSIQAGCTAYIEQVWGLDLRGVRQRFVGYLLEPLQLFPMTCFTLLTCLTLSLQFFERCKFLKARKRDWDINKL